MKPNLKGATVKRGDKTATILSDSLTFGNQNIWGCCFLDRPLDGCRYWNISDLIIVA